jgi:endonuclease/exonuclease/phosphatase family metal-dependent hydrolase
VATASRLVSDRPAASTPAMRHPQKVCEEHIKPFAIKQSVCWRIDLILTTANIAYRHVSGVEKAATYEERWSDHAPVTCAFDWEIAAVPAPRSPTGSLDAETLADAAADS